MRVSPAVGMRDVRVMRSVLREPMTVMFGFGMLMLDEGVQGYLMYMLVELRSAPKKRDRSAQVITIHYNIGRVSLLSSRRV